MGRVAIYGASGRIGKLVTRRLFDDAWLGRLHPSWLVASGNREDFRYALTYDTDHGRYGPVLAPGEHESAGMVIRGQQVATYFVRDPARVPWEQHGPVDVVIDCTGTFKSKEKAQVFLDCGARRVLIPAPATGPADGSFVWDVNHKLLTPCMRFVSPTSCTTNGLAPPVLVLHEAFGIEQGTFVTVHAVTKDQELHDSRHRKDPRRGRSAMRNIIPTSTGAAGSIGLVIPELTGRLIGRSVRVPVLTGSLIELTVTLQQTVTVEDVANVLREAAVGSMQEVLSCMDDPIVSSDIIGDPHIAVVDMQLIKKVGSRTFMIAIWYDNEYAFANSLLRMAEHMARQMR